MAAQKPVVALVPGAFAPPEVYEPYTKALELAGYELVFIELPSCNGARPPNSSAETDTAAVRQVIEHLADRERHILLVMHSWGGAVGSNALEGLDVAGRLSRGLTGGVTYLIYLCGYLIPEKASLLGLIHEMGPDAPSPGGFDIAEDGTWFPLNPREFLYNDLVEEHVAAIVPKLTRFHGNVLTEEMQYAAWRHIPSTYVYTTLDMALPLSCQKFMTTKIKAENGLLAEEEYESSHSPFLSKTKDMVSCVDRAVARAAEEGLGYKTRGK